MNIFRQNQLLLTCAVLAAAVLLSCRKNTEEVVTLLSENEAAEIVETTVSGRSAGAAMPTVDVSELLQGYLQNCGIPGDTTLQRSNTVGAVNYAYTFNLGWLIHCNNLNIPQDASVTVAGNGTFNTQHWTGSDSASGSLSLSGLSPQVPAYAANGSYTRNGDVTGSLRNTDPTLSVTTTINLSDLSIRKSDYQITGGTGTVVIVATNGRGRTETVNGTLVFNGDGSVTVTVNGHTHSFSI